jgi:uncharacterized membrane protein
MTERPVEEPVDAQVVGDDDEPVEIVDGEPVLEDAAGALTPASASSVLVLAAAASPAVQAAAAAATGFVAGAATLALVRRRESRRGGRRALPRRAGDVPGIVGSRTFLIDVHMLRPDR